MKHMFLQFAQARGDRWEMPAIGMTLCCAIQNTQPVLSVLCNRQNAYADRHLYSSSGTSEQV